ncbi:MAG: LytR C-terminal domain-containing protein [Acidimicrobiia bacterium]|nr:LytR C-terminal domain-containing protein [Acidimicrobiia bacterium]
MTAPRRPSEQATIRGAIVVFAAVLIGVALLSRSDGGIFGSAEAGGAGPTTTTQTTRTTTTVPTSTVPTNTGGAAATDKAHDPKQVKVIVVNAAGGIVGIGSDNSQKLTQAGFQVLPVKNSDQDVDATGLFFNEGFQADATAVKAALGFGNVPVQAAPAQAIIPEAADANVIVVLGKNYNDVTGG